MVSFLPQTYNTVLEIGCLSGGFSKNLLLECEYWGVDPLLANGNVVHQRKTKLLACSIEDAWDELPSGFFDLVILNDVLEHLVDPPLVLEKLRRLLSRTGVITGSVPNVRHSGLLWDLLVRKDWRYREQGVLDSTHLRFFTIRSLSRTLRESGYAVERLQGINSELGYSRLTRSVSLILITLLSFGWFADTRFPQIGFRAASL